jgi:hypothetical protein
MLDESKNVARSQRSKSLRIVLASLPDETANNKFVTDNGSTGKPAFLSQVAPKLLEDNITRTKRSRTLRLDGIYAPKNSKKAV